MRRTLFFLARNCGPAQLPLYEEAFGHLGSQVLRSLVQLDVFAALHQRGPSTAAALAHDGGVDADLLLRLLRFADTRGWVRQTRHGRFALTRQGRTLVADAPSSLAPFVLYGTDPSTVRAGEAIGLVLRGGGSGFGHAHGTSVWQWFAEHPALAATFDGAMRSLSSRDVDHVAAAICSSQVRHVCDLGGGTGALLAAVLQACPQAQATLVERAGVLEDARRELTARGVIGRTRLLAGSFFDELPLVADVFLLRNVLHDWSDVDVRRILCRVRAAMRPTDVLYLVETLCDGRPDAIGALSDVAMMLVTDGGQQRSQDGWRRLGAQAGLALTRSSPLPLPMRLLQFRPAKPAAAEARVPATFVAAPRDGAGTMA